MPRPGGHLIHSAAVSSNRHDTVTYCIVLILSIVQIVTGIEVSHEVYFLRLREYRLSVGLNGQYNEGRSLFHKGSTNREKWEAKCLIKEFANNRWSVATASINRLIKINWKMRVNRTEVRQWLSEVCQDSWLTFQWFRIAYDMQSRWCSLQSEKPSWNTITYWTV